MTLGTWFWPKSQSLTFQCTIKFWSVDWKIHLSIQCNWDLLNLVIRSRWLHWVLESMIEPNLPLARWKIRNCPSAVKTLKMTILPFWWSDQISCGIVIQTWSNGPYEFIMLMWVNFHEIWLSIGHSWLFPQYSWFLGQLSNWLGKIWNQDLKLGMDKLGSPIWSMKVILGNFGQNIFVQTQTLIWVNSARRSLE